VGFLQARRNTCGIAGAAIGVVVARLLHRV